MPSIRTRVVALAGALCAALAVGSAADAHAASYYNIVNTDTGRALEATVNGVKLAPRNPSNLLQQFKRTDLTHAGTGQFQAILKNRLLDCLRTDRSGPNPNLIGHLKLGNCAPSDTRNRWLHRWGNATPTPSVPGFQLKNVKSGEYVGEEFCFISCGPVPLATLLDAQLVESDPLQLGPAVKWQFKFAASAPRRRQAYSVVKSQARRPATRGRAVDPRTSRCR